MSQKSAQRGVSLIESLVALVVLALGVLGLAGIQTRTLVETRTTNARAIATSMAEDMLERMQANAGARTIPPIASPYVVDFGAPPAAAVDCLSAGCNPTEMAAFDLNQWKTTLGNLLPAGDATVFRSQTDSSQFGILISWTATQAKGEGGASAADQVIFDSAISVRDGTGATGTGDDDVACPAASLCHLVYIRPR